jgi:hypothetical protein
MKILTLAIFLLPLTLKAQTSDFLKIESGLTSPCSSSRFVDGYQNLKVFACSGGPDLPGGFVFKSSLGVSSPYGSTSKPQRLLEVRSIDGAFNETFLYFNVIAGGPDSHDMKSVMLLLPRKVVPSVLVDGEDIEITLTTGEKVTVDRTDSQIKSGALMEGEHDLTTDRQKRKAANIHYTGSGISIRVDHRYEYPTQGAITAEVKQAGRTCKLPKLKIWDANGKLISRSDAQLLDVLKAACPKEAFKLD